MCPEIRPFSWNWHTPYCSNEAPDSSPCKSPLNVWVPLLSRIPYQCWLSEGTSEADFPECLRRQWFWLIFHLSAHPPTYSPTMYSSTHPPACPSTYLSFTSCPSTYPSTHPSTIHLPNPTSTHPYIHPRGHLPTDQPIYPFTTLPTIHRVLCSIP